jgi:hypothetical protein
MVVLLDLLHVQLQQVVDRCTHTTRSGGGQEGVRRGSGWGNPG